MRCGIKQAELARKVGISAPYLSQIERGQRPLPKPLRAAVAHHLQISETDLDPGPDRAVSLQDAAGLIADAAVPRDAQAFVAEYPRWADVVEGLANRISALAVEVETLKEGRRVDPALSDALHEIVSMVTSVRATSAILVEDAETLSPQWQARFQANIHADSARLSESAGRLSDLLDRTDAPATQALDPRARAEAMFAARDWCLERIEEGRGRGLRAQLRQLQRHGVAVSRRWLERAAADAADLPRPVLLRELARGDALDPAALASRLNRPADLVLRRLALSGPEVLQRPAGLIVMDAAGSTLLHRPVEGFPVPGRAVPCPLWPIFAALSNPGQCLRQRVILPGRDAARFTCWAAARTDHPAGQAGPPRTTATMLILADAREDLDAWQIGSTCRLCPRSGCPARREPAILAPQTDNAREQRQAADI